MVDFDHGIPNLSLATLGLIKRYMSYGGIAMLGWLLKCMDRCMSLLASRYAFYRDRDCGQFTGNIVEALAPLFPQETATWMLQQPPIEARWSLLVRNMKDGPEGHLFTIDGMFPQGLKLMFEVVYQGYPRDPNYPDIYNEHHAHGMPMVCLELASQGRISVWSGTAVSANATSSGP
jgi:hypothetical protein